MESIQEYASSSSSDGNASEAAEAQSRRARYRDALGEGVDKGVKQQRLELAKRLAERQKRVRHDTTQEEAAFAFRGYRSKRRRRTAQTNADDKLSVGEELPLLATQHDEGLGGSKRLKDKLVPLYRQNRRRFAGHSKAVNELQWHPHHPKLFLSASMDATVRVWNWSAQDDYSCRRVLRQHSLGVKSAKWSLDGRTVLSGGYDGRAYCVDTETGQVEKELWGRDVILPTSQTERVTTVHFHPTDPNSVLVGTDRGRIYGHDLRSKAPECKVNTYTKSFGDVHDLLFLGEDGQRFVSSAGVIQRDASNQTLLVWDWRNATLLYDRLDDGMMAYSCLRSHPSKSYFVAQCSENYASLFSLRAPYRCLKGSSVSGRRPHLRFSGGHEVEGYSILCSFSPDGSMLASGDANGRVVLYCTAGRRVSESFTVYDQSTPCICAEYQVHSAVGSPRLLTGSGAGDIDLFEA